MAESGSRRKRVRRRPEDAQREILDAAETMLRELDFRDLEVEELMNRTAMQRSNFYNYFADRNELVMALVARVAEEMFAATALWLETEGGDRREAMRKGLRSVVRIWHDHSHVLRAMNEASYHDEAAQQFFRRGIVQDYIEQVARMLRRERRAGLNQVVNPTETARALILMNINYLSERFGENGPSNLAVSRIIEGIWVATVYPGDGPPGTGG